MKWDYGNLRFFSWEQRWSEKGSSYEDRLWRVRHQHFALSDEKDQMISRRHCCFKWRGGAKLCGSCISLYIWSCANASEKYIKTYIKNDFSLYGNRRLYGNNEQKGAQVTFVCWCDEVWGWLLHLSVKCALRQVSFIPGVWTSHALSFKIKPVVYFTTCFKPCQLHLTFFFNSSISVAVTHEESRY